MANMANEDSQQQLRPQQPYPQQFYPSYQYPQPPTYPFIAPPPQYPYAQQSIATSTPIQSPSPLIPPVSEPPRAKTPPPQRFSPIGARNEEDDYIDRF